MYNYAAVELVSDYLLTTYSGREIVGETFATMESAISFAINVTKDASKYSDTNKTVIGVYRLIEPEEIKLTIYDIDEDVVDFTKPLALVHCGKVYRTNS